MIEDVVAELRRQGLTDVDGSTLARALYSSDASLYRIVPQVVVRPRHRDELDLVLQVARLTGVPLTMRGAGTSIAGNAVGGGIIVDTRRHLNRIIALDSAARAATVEPGVVHAQLQRVAQRHGLRFGPDPSTHSRCTIGGMIGNNACGSRALGFGRTSDNLLEVDALFGGEDAAQRLYELVESNLAHVRTTFGRFSRQVSGYALEHLLPERRSIHRFIAGSEGTLAVVKQATLALVPDKPRMLLALGYPSIVDAADAVPALLAAGGNNESTMDGTGLLCCEGLDSRIVDLARATTHVPPLPRGEAWLFVEAAGEGREGVLTRVARAAEATDHRMVHDPLEAEALWRIREDGAGLASRGRRRRAHSGWEDAAVPPIHLGAWLREFSELLREHDLEGFPYGHFGDGCVHVRIDFDFASGTEPFREFLVACAKRLTRYGGSLSGEHGDGRARSELLPLMYDERSLRLFQAVKAICDPENLLNPGVLVDPDPLDSNLRPARAGAGLHNLAISGVHRCTGVGKCVATSTSQLMCPSYAATREEKDSTRGRARVLQEALDGTLVKGVADPAVSEALDLCLSCKGCLSDCPTGVDMASYKSQVLHQTYAGRLRPRTHYSLGWLPRWAAITAPLAPAVNWLLQRPRIGQLAKALTGIDHRRSLPAFAPTSARRALVAGGPTQPDVWLWLDTFTYYFNPHIAQAAQQLLATAGLRAAVIPARSCCGLTWISVGHLDRARALAIEAARRLAGFVASGTPVVALEPSCLATLRSDAVHLAGTAEAQEVARGVKTLAEFLNGIDWSPPDLAGTQVVVQPHCHHASVLGFDPDRSLLVRSGAHLDVVPGCCGLAGNFGMEKGHYETSVAVANTHLLPAMRRRGNAVVLADGMSCRVQLDDLAGVRALHLAELLWSRAHGASRALPR